MHALNRRQVVAGGLAGAVSLWTATQSRSLATQTPEADTPPGECLTMESFPVFAGERPHDVAPAANGQGVWYTAQRAGALGLLDPTSGHIETVPLGAGSSPHGVIVGPDGGAWVTDSGLNAIVKVDPDTFELTSYPVPGGGANLNTAAIDPDGVVWFTGQGGIVGRVDPSRHQPGESAEILESPRGIGPYGITVTPEGVVYFASLAGSYVGRIDVESDGFSVTVLEPPTPNQGTRRVWSDSNGVVWSSQWNAGQVGRYDPETDTWLEWRLPGDAPQAYAVYVDERDDVWLSDFGSNSVVRFDPDSESFVPLALPEPSSNVRQIHGRQGEVWAPLSGVDQLLVVRCE